jgi:ABC-type transporter Mla subunit MlaD
VLPFRIRFADRIVAAFLLFVVLATAAVLFVVVKNQGIFQRRVSFRTVFEDGGGLKAETPVKLAGIEIGSVRSVTLTPDDKVEVVFDILEQYRDRIVADPPGELCKAKKVSDVLLDDSEKLRESERKEKCGTRVTVGLPAGLGAFLQSGLEIRVGNKKANPIVPAGGFVPAEESEGLNELLARLQKEGLVQAARDIVVQVDTLLKSINDQAGPVQQTLNNVQVATARVASGKGLIGELTRDNSASMQQVQASLKRLDTTLANLEQTSEDAQTIVGDVQARRETVTRFLDNLERFSDDAKQVGVDLRVFARDARDVPPDIREAVKNLDKRIDDLGDVLKGLKRAVPFGLAEEEEKKRTSTEPVVQPKSKNAPNRRKSTSTGAAGQPQPPVPVPTTSSDAADTTTPTTDQSTTDQSTTDQSTTAPTPATSESTPTAPTPATSISTTEAQTTAQTTDQSTTTTSAASPAPGGGG